MVDYTSQHQLQFKEFNMINKLNLDADNRWIQLGKFLPWDKLVKIYTQHFSDCGRPSINPRMVIGSLIIKHKLDLSDEETVRLIQENPYMQAFLGLGEFTPMTLYSPSMFVEWRKKLGNDAFVEFTNILISIVHDDKIEKSVSEEKENKGKMQLDATVADQNITYPNDLGLLNTGRLKTEKMIDILYDLVRSEFDRKPRTYRRIAHKRYLAESKKRRTNKKSLRKAIRYLLNCLDRNIGHIHRMLDMLDENPLSYRHMRELWIITHLNQQQRKMYDEKSRSCADRIVSIAQPHVRPIKRGKSGKDVEFGAKIGVVYKDGYVTAETISWDAYHESADLKPHVKAYKELYGYYPELVQVDKIYGTNANRKWCTKHEIRMTVQDKGPKKKRTQYEKRKRKKEFNERNRIEGKFGQAKQAYSLNNVKAKLRNTSESWIGIVLFVTNVMKFAESHDILF